MTDYYDPYDIHNYAGPQNLNNNDNDDNNLGIKKKNVFNPYENNNKDDKNST